MIAKQQAFVHRQNVSTSSISGTTSVNSASGSHRPGSPGSLEKTPHAHAGNNPANNGNGTHGNDLSANKSSPKISESEHLCYPLLSSATASQSQIAKSRDGAHFCLSVHRRKQDERQPAGCLLVIGRGGRENGCPIHYHQFNFCLNGQPCLNDNASGTMKVKQKSDVNGNQVAISNGRR